MTELLFSDSDRLVSHQWSLRKR